MGIFSRFLGFSSEMMNDGQGNIIDLNDFCHRIEIASYHRLAMEMAIDLIGNAVARVDWKHYKKHEEQESLLTSRLNGEPNRLETSTEFYKKFTRRLLLHNEVLVVEINNELYVADDFEREQVTFNSVSFKCVTINGKKAPKQCYTMKEAIYVTYADENIRLFLEGYMVLLNDLASSAVEAYKSNKTRRFVLSTDLVRANLTDVQKDFNALMEQQLASFISSQKASAIYAKPKNTELVDMSDRNFIHSTDARGTIEDIFKTVANTFHIPPEYMLGGSVTQVVVDNFLVNAVYPIVDLWKEAFNNHQFSETERRKGTMIKPDTTKSRIVDLNTVGNFIRNVFPTGALSLNDVVTKYLQLDPLPEYIGDTRVITKNYSELDAFVNGETNPQTMAEQRIQEDDLQPEDEDEEPKEATLLSKFLGGK